MYRPFRHLLAASAIALACVRTPPEDALRPLAPDPLDAGAFPVDSARAVPIASGVAHRYYWMPQGPWAVHVLDIDRSACWTLDAAKGADGAIGRARTSDIVSNAANDAGRGVVAAVNADFFLFSPPGVPTGAHVEHGVVITGPIARPVLAIDSAGTITIDTLSSPGWLELPRYATEITGWNRPLAGGLSLFDASWGARTDSSTGAVEVTVSSRGRGVVVAVDTLPSGVDIPRNGIVLVAGRASPALVRMQLAALQPGTDTVSTSIALAPFHPRAAVGGFPILVRRGAEVARLDSAGGAGFGPARHPRTAVGTSRNGARILLVVVDGRQPPYSAGLTLRELARFMLALGAEDAINLDGGGSTAMAVVRRGRRPQVGVVNRPSDQQGERAVGNALLVARGACDEQREPER